MRTAHQWIICLKPVRSEGWDCASNKCQSDSVHLHNSRQLGTNRLGPDKRANRTCDLCYLPRHAQLSPCPLSGHHSVWIAKVVGFLADYRLSSRFAPGIVRTDLKGYFGRFSTS